MSQRDRARAIAIARRRQQPPSWLAWLALAAVLLAAAAAQAAAPPAPGGYQVADNSTDGRTTPPVIGQPNGQADGDAKPGTGGGSLQRGSDGVITPPPSIDPGMPVAKPSPDAFPTPTVRPPGTPGGDPKVVPK